MRFRLYPTPEQETQLLEHCAQARFVWNVGLEQRNMYRPLYGPTPNFAKSSIELTEARSETWLSEGSATVQQQGLRDLDQAFRNWWGGSHGRPTWRIKGQHEGFQIVGSQAKRWKRLSKKRAKVLIPKIGWVNWRWTRNPGDPKSYRVKLDKAGKWWISFAVIPDLIPAPLDGNIIGVDCGVAQSFVMSDGLMVKVPGLNENEKARSLRLKRKLARQIKGSNHRETTKQAINRVEHRRINKVKDCVEKLTTMLATENDLIRIEDLNIVKMTKSKKGTVETPGVGVSQKSKLNNLILNQGWGLFKTRLEHKAFGRVERINPAFTSQQCNVCKNISSENRESQAVSCCKSCGHVANADVNAAQNIAAGLAVNGRGDSLLGSVKRQPTVSFEKLESPGFIRGEEVKYH